MMFAVGHFALGYLTGKLSSKFLNVHVSLPLLFLVSVFPDVDILFPFLEHRGPLHSVLFWCLIFVPLFWLYRKRAAPYFVALLQHSLIGDYLTGGSQLLWPFSLKSYGLDIGIRSTFNLGLEWVLFIASVVVMFKAKDLKMLLKPDSTNFVLLIPLMTVLLPMIVSFPLYISMALLVPHLFFICLFGISLYVALREFQN
ncbi:MAG: metal-dependent hydrolase [Candidatus Bathyarchaeota archaeon]|nr:MAG: metal-dependent hydrolase [Candidatus Bathyarchaeota archaeon]